MVRVTLYPKDALPALRFDADAVSFVNNDSYGPARNFNIATDDNTEGEDHVVLVNVSNVVAAEVAVVE